MAVLAAQDADRDHDEPEHQHRKQADDVGEAETRRGARERTARRPAKLQHELAPLLELLALLLGDALDLCRRGTARVGQRLRGLLQLARNVARAGAAVLLIGPRHKGAEETEL